MFGLFLVIFLVLLIIGILLLRFGGYQYEDLAILLTIICGITLMLMLFFIPITKLQDKQNVEYVKIFEQTLNNHRTENLSDFERFQIIEEINEINGNIASYKVKGQKWYNNKWIYDKSYATLEYIK